MTWLDSRTPPQPQVLNFNLPEPQPQHRLDHSPHQHLRSEPCLEKIVLKAHAWHPHGHRASPPPSTTQQAEDPPHSASDTRPQEHPAINVQAVGRALPSIKHHNRLQGWDEGTMFNKRARYQEQQEQQRCGQSK
ncbi:hypothetical protein CF319_g8900 [Tilletia indica]|nr:hypothetical protein CF319_g8900 [Tilletia indica]